MPDTCQFVKFPSGPAIKPVRGKLVTGMSVDNDRCDERKKAKPGCHQERLGPLCLFVCVVVGLNGDGVMKTRNSRDVQGARDEGAHPETANIVDEVGNNDIDDLLGDLWARERICGRGFRRCTHGERSQNAC